MVTPTNPATDKTPGYATPQGTQRYRERHQSDCATGHFRQGNDLTVSSLGIGTYLGQPDDETDRRVTDAIVESVRHGLNLIDTAINYRFMRGERCVREALTRLFATGEVVREELMVCTKGGFVPARDRVGWFRREYVENDRFSIQPSDLVAGSHCLHPQYLHDQIERSLDNLGLETVDVYYIHNPENELAEIGRDTLYEKLLNAFEVAEAAVSAGKIRAYGIATWNCLRVPPHHPYYLDLAHVKDLARQASPAGTDHFQFIQFPLNAAMREGLETPTQPIDATLVPTLEAAQKLGLNAIASAAIAQGKAIGQLPAPISSQLADTGLKAAGQALQFTRSCPGLLCALVGMKTPAHVAENLALTQVEPLSSSVWG